MKGFRTFLLRGNVVDLAIAVVIGVAFEAVITALVSDLLTPLLAAIGGQPNFASLQFTLNHSRFLYGAFLDHLISFVVLVAVVYFVVVLPVNALLVRSRLAPVPDPTTKLCPECCSTIALAARRCPFCTAVLGAPEAAVPGPTA